MPGQSGGGWGRGVYSQASIQGLPIGTQGVPNAFGWLALGYQPPAVGADVPKTIYPGDGDYPWPTGSIELQIVSDSTSDTSAGTGARVIRVVGTDIDYNEKVEDVTLNGTTPVDIPGGATWYRVNRIFLEGVGVSERNIGTIKVYDKAASTKVLAHMQPEEGVSVDGVYTVPVGVTAFPLSINSLLLRDRTGDRYADVAFFANMHAEGYPKGKRLVDRVEPYTGQYRPYVPPLGFPGGTDFEARLLALSTNQTAVFLGITFLIVQDSEVNQEIVQAQQNRGSIR